jgi:hypothetical protein
VLDEREQHVTAAQKDNCEREREQDPKRGPTDQLSASVHEQVLPQLAPS